MAVYTKFRLIAYSQEIVDGQPIFVSSNCLPIKALKYEPAGHSFHSAALKLLGVQEDKNDADDKKVADDKEQTYLPSDSYSSKSKKKSGTGDKQQDHYALLGLGHLRYLATEDQIRKSYRETALRFHPDKQAALLLAEETEAAKQAKKDEIESHFKAIQEAYEVLIDPVKRRIYDSTDEFDDEIPTDCAPQDFFKVFGPAFMRNGRWSVNQPIPSLGDDNTSLKDVDNFYNFWYSFKSWREFPHADEFDLEQAESRDHKRWMERQNAKLTEKARKEDYARIQEERQRKVEEERQAAEAALQQKKVKEKEKKLLRKERARLRTLSGPILSQHLLDISDDDVERLCMSLDIEKLRSLCENMEGRQVLLEQAKVLRDALSSKKEEKPWNKEEIELLRKGMQKFPKGTSRRWEVISEYIGTGRSVEEIMKATKTVLLQKPDSSKAFDTFLEKRKPGAQSIDKSTDNQNSTSANGVPSSSEQDVWSAVQERALVQALKAFPKETSQRWERVSAAVPGKTVNQCKKKFAMMKESFRNKKTAV
uniref:DnaJ isogeny subfamily C member 2 n=1 Tax=Cajanus cajan TaxID=3821 RepID=A0A151T822_CAJCA|nr:DnaJ isogeny subfamily C member 2 [Cajanus cajan]